MSNELALLKQAQKFDAGMAVASGLFDMYQADVQYSRANELMDKQINANMAMQQSQNEYNSAPNQVNRLIAAGLNKDLAASNGGGTQPLTPSVNVPSAPSAKGALANAYALYQQGQKAAADVDLTKAQADYYRSLVPNKQAQTNLFIRQLQSQDILDEMNSAHKDQYLAQVDELEKKCSYWDSEIEVNSANTSYLRSRQFEQDVINQFAEEREQAKLNAIFSEIGFNNAQRDKIREEIRFAISSFQARLDNIESDTNNKNAQAGYTSRLTETLYDELLESLNAKKFGLVVNENGEYEVLNSAYRASAIMRITDWVVGNVGRVYQHHTFSNVSDPMSTITEQTQVPNAQGGKTTRTYQTHK